MAKRRRSNIVPGVGGAAGGSVEHEETLERPGPGVTGSPRSGFGDDEEAPHQHGAEYGEPVGGNPQGEPARNAQGVSGRAAPEKPPRIPEDQTTRKDPEAA